MEDSFKLASASLSYFVRDDLPSVTTATSTSSSSRSSSSSSSRTSSSSASSASSSSSSASSSRPSASSSSSSTGMPTVETTSSESFTTPPIRVPSNNGNPYISRTSQPSGTVFIAVGSVVAVILLVFALFHLIKSLTASSLAKKTVDDEKIAYKKFAHNNNVAYGQPGLFQNTEYKGSVSKLPLINGSSGLGATLGAEYSSSGLSDNERAASRHDLTSMFISPTKEMTGNRVGSHNFNSSVTNLSVYGRTGAESGNGLAPNRNSTIIPNYYINDSFNNSEYNLTPEATNSGAPGERKQRNPIPSMYLEDLIDS